MIKNYYNWGVKMEDSKKKRKIGSKGIQMPHTYLIIAGIVLLAYLLTFLIPVGRFNTKEVTYTLDDGEEKTREVLDEDSFRYKYNYDITKLPSELDALTESDTGENEIDFEGLKSLLQTDPESWTQDDLDDVGLEESVIYSLFGDSVYDTSKKIKQHAGIWGTEDVGGFGILNYVYEGLVTGDRGSSAVGLVMLLLVVGGSFGIVMRTGSIDSAMYAFIRVVKQYHIVVIPALAFIFSLGGAVFGLSEECIAFAMIVIPLVVKMGYDSLVGIGITFVASQVGNATSWMNPFGVVVAQGIAGVPVMSGSGFRIAMWIITTTLLLVYLVVYALKIKKNPKESIAYESDKAFRTENQEDSENKKFTLGDILVLVTFALGMVWLVWGVVSKGYYLAEIASVFFVIGLVSGIIGVIFKLGGMSLNSIATGFQEGATSMVGAALVVGMAKGIVLVMGGTEATDFTILNTILYTVGNSISGLPTTVSAVCMYIFQSVFNFFVTSGTGQAALTMPIMAPLSDIVGVSRQVAVLCYQLGAGFMDAIVPTSASLMGVLAVAKIDWGRYFKWQYKMQLFFFGIGCIFIVVAIMIGL